MANTPILAGTDFTGASNLAVARAAELSRRLALPLWLIHVIDESALRPTRTPLPLGWRTSFTGGPQSRGDAFRKFDRVSRELDQLQEACAAVRTLRRYGRPHAQIVAAARRAKARLIVVGAHERQGAAERFLLGSTADRVLRTSGAPVLIVRRSAARPYRTALVPVDLGEQTHRQFDVLRDLLPDLSLSVLHVLPTAHRATASKMTGPETTARRLAFEAGFAKDAVSFHVARGDPRDAILKRQRDERADLIVVGTHGRKGLERLLLGSVAEHVIRASGADVLAVPPAGR